VRHALAIALVSYWLRFWREGSTSTPRRCDDTWLHGFIASEAKWHAVATEDDLKLSER